MASSEKPTSSNRKTGRPPERPPKTGSPRWLISTIAVVAAVVVIAGIIATFVLGGRLF